MHKDVRSSKIHIFSKIVICYIALHQLIDVGRCSTTDESLYYASDMNLATV